MARYTVYLKNVIVGHSDLEDADASLGRARGHFRPGVGYELVQPIFALYTQAVPRPGAAVADQDKLDRYHRSRDALGLTLKDDGGNEIRTSAIHISDYRELGGGTLEVEALITDREYWQRRERVH
jgi:hypothetical protein